jgi:hypothetical protein
MEDLLNSIELDPVASTIGLLVIALGIRMVLGAVKTAIKIVFVVVILVGASLFLYGGQLT